MSDKLRFDYINSLGQLYGEVLGTWWPITLIDVETGACHIDVCGLHECKYFEDFRQIKDDNGILYDKESFYVNL